MLSKKTIAGGVLAFAAIIFGFMMLIRGCLSKYDERSAIAPALVFEKNGKKLVFAIIEFEKTTSYSRNGGMVRKTVNSSYYIQTNDGTTAEFIAGKKIKSHRAIKNFPVEVLGAAGGNAWIFMGEPMAFDAFSLSKVADIGILENKNPALKNKFPVERRYYSFNNKDQQIYFTAKDGSKWKLNTATLAAEPSDYNPGGNAYEAMIDAIDQQIKKNQAGMDSNYQQNSRVAADAYRAKQITYNEFQSITKIFYRKRDSLDDVRDSLWAIKHDLEQNQRELEDQENRIESLQRINPGFSQIKSNQDSSNGAWWGLYDEKEMHDLYNQFSYSPAYDETARRTLRSATISYQKSGNHTINTAAVSKAGTNSFLAGGFLLDKKTARPVYVSGSNDFLVVHKDQVGQTGMIQLSRVNKNGQVLWSINTNLTDWADWQYNGNTLYVFGTDNKELSSGEINLLLCINTSNGTASKYDYFKKSTRK